MFKPGSTVDVSLADADNSKRIESNADCFQVLTMGPGDDEPKVAASLARLLRHHDCQIAHGGEAGLSRLAEEEFDVVFCDLMMPEVTGMDVYETLQREGRQREQRVVFVTGGAFTPRARQFVAGVDATIVEKPFDARSIRGALERLSDEARPAARPPAPLPHRD